MFIREVRLTVGNRQFTGDGSFGGFRISFSIEKTLLGMANQSTLILYNLGTDLIDSISSRYSPVVLEVGWQDEGALIQAFRGQLINVLTTRSGPDRISEITALDGGQSIILGSVQRNFATAKPVAEVVRFLASQLPGVTIGSIQVRGNLKSKGKVLSGNVAKELDDLANEYGFSWSVQDGVFQAIDDRDALPQVWRIGSRSGLQEARQMVGGPFQITTGVEIRTILNPRILPGQQVQLVWDQRSDFPKSLAGIYKVHNLATVGDTHTNEWTMTVQSFQFGFGGAGVI